MIMTLGHSTYPASDFAEICLSAGVDTIIDTRSHPGSSAHPQYNKERMARWLVEAGIGYEWWPALGGWRDEHAPLATAFAKYDVDVSVYCHSAFPKQRIAKRRELQGPGFTNYGFHDYSFFMSLPEFLHGVDRLLERAGNLAMICCEACWTRCHRSMIADHLVWRGSDAVHIEPRFRKIKLPRVVTKLKPHSTVIGERLQRYHPAIIAAWKSHVKGAVPEAEVESAS